MEKLKSRMPRMSLPRVPALASVLPLHKIQHALAPRENGSGRVPRPYANLRERLTQTIVNEWTIVIILIIVQLWVFLSWTQSALSIAGKSIISACDTTQDLVSDLASSSHYAAAAANDLIVESVDSAIRGLQTLLTMLVTGVEHMILFYVDLLVGTYECLIASAIHGVSSAALNATTTIVSFVNDTVTAIADEIQDGLQEISEFLNDAQGVVQLIADTITGEDSEWQSVNLTVESLENLSIPTSINSAIMSLQENVPTYSDVKNATDSVIELPFELLKAEITNAFAKNTYFDKAVLTVPEKQNVTMFTPSDISSAIDTLSRDIKVITIIFTALLVFTAIACVAWHVITEKKDWNWMMFIVKRNSEMAAEKTDDIQEREIRAIIDANNRIGAKIGIIIAKWVGPNNAVMARWWVDYVTYRYAITCLLVGVAGVLAALLQLGLVVTVQRAVPAIIDAIQTFAANVVEQEKAIVSQWVNNTNSVISATESDINDSVLGWVYNGTGTINNTLTAFMSNINGAINDTLGDTPLYSVVSTVVYCTVGNKVASLQKGLSWVHENSQVSFPRVNGSTLGTGTNAAVISSAIDKPRSAAGSVFDSVMEELWGAVLQGLYTSIALIALWLAYAIGGLIYCYTVYHHNNMGKDQRVEELPGKRPPPPPPRLPIACPSNELMEQRWLTPEFCPPSLLASQQSLSAAPSPIRATHAADSNYSLPLPSPALFDNRKVPIREQAPPRKSTVASVLSERSHYIVSRKDY